MPASKSDLQKRREALLAKRRTDAQRRQRLRKRIQKISARVHHLAHRIKHYHKPAPLPDRLWDSVNAVGIPGAAADQAVGGYVGGPYENYAEVVATFPHARHVAIAPQASMDIPLSADAGFLDIEQYDATPAQYAGWYQRQRRRGYDGPLGEYSSRSEQPSIPKQSREKRWLADPTGSLHSVAGYDAVQSVWETNYDESLVERSFWT